MAVVEVLRAVGSWSVSLSSATPKTILDALDYFGHIVINNGEVDAVKMGDALLKNSRYTGVYRGKSTRADRLTLRGPGMAFWLGDEEEKGDVVETQLTIPPGTPFQTAINSILGVNKAVRPGTIYNLPSPTYDFSGVFQYHTRRNLIEYVCDTLGTDWKVNGDATLDAGLESDLFRTIPRAALAPRQGSGSDMFLKSFSGHIETEQDMEDFTTRVLMLAAGEEGATVTATADIAPAKNPYKDLWGEPVKLTRMVSESETDATNAPARAQLSLNRFSGSRDAITLSTGDYDLKGEVVVGDYLYVWAPDEGLQDVANEVYFQGERMYPMRLRLTEMAWPVVAGMSVGFRDNDGKWYDLTPYIIPDSGESQLTVGGYTRNLVTGNGGVAGSRPVADTSTPDAPTWNLPFTYGVYQSDTGETRAQVEIKWNRPLNVDGSTILDGDHYEIRYRSSSVPFFPSSHDQMAARTHDQLSAGTQAQPIVYVPGAWRTDYAPFDELTYLLQDLPTNMPYEIQVRAVDAAKPPNAGDWSPVEVFQTSGDTLPPATPAAPTVAASTLAVKVTHNLGVVAGGEFNLDLDLHHFEVHGGLLEAFIPDDTTLLGKIIANSGMILGQVPVVGVVNVGATTPVWYKVIAVDNDGNASAASPGAVSTALLVDNAHISDLSVAKVTAGTISADWFVGARIKTGNTGARAELNMNGVELFNSSNTRTVFLDALTGKGYFTGQVQSGTVGTRIVMNEEVGGTFFPEMRFYPSTGSTYSYINAPSTGNASLGMNSGGSGGYQTTLWLFDNDARLSYTQVGTGATRGGSVRINPDNVWMEIYDTAGTVSAGVVHISRTFATLGWRHPDGRDANLSIYDDEILYFKGYGSRGFANGGRAALWLDNIGWAGGSVSFGYGATMIGDVCINASWTDFTGYLNVGVVVFNSTSTSFMVGNGTAGRNGFYSAQVWRIKP